MEFRRIVSFNEAIVRRRGAGDDATVERVDIVVSAKSAKIILSSLRNDGLAVQPGERRAVADTAYGCDKYVFEAIALADVVHRSAEKHLAPVKNCDVGAQLLDGVHHVARQNHRAACSLICAQNINENPNGDWIN